MKRSIQISITLIFVTFLVDCSPRTEPTRIFGVAMGDPLSRLKKPKLDQSDPNGLRIWYEFQPNEPNAAFSKYEAMVLPKHGVCALMALSSDTDQQQRSLDAASFNDLVATLTAKYGKPRAEDNGFSGEFHRASYYWDKKKDTGLTLPPTLESIDLEYFPVGGDATIWYVFSNELDCVKEAKTAGL